MRHRIGSFNELSARYTELPPHWYLPDENNVRTRVGKPGHYSYEPVEKDKAVKFIQELNAACMASYTLYETFLTWGVAHEQARMFLHVNHYSEMYWTVNARSLMNFIALRNHDTAQWEIKQYAEEAEQMLFEEMPITYGCFVSNGRIAP
jgi:thymidylate synthase (FAD)